MTASHPMVRFGRAWVVLLGLLSVTGLPGCTGGSRGADIEELLAELTLDEKLSLLHGDRDPDGIAGAGYLPGVPRLGIPPLRLADGPAGVRTGQPATALPAPVALAATFDPALAREYGRVMGREGRARGQDVLLAPMVNIVRVPYAGRNFETLGEDPYLASTLVAEEVRGVQEEGLIATIKHYIANNQEAGRQSVSANVDARTLHEIYLPGFEAAVRAGTGSVMGSYNRINGTYACENEEVLTKILREELGFDGWVMSDWGATHSTGAAITAGMDMEMPSGRWFGEALKQAVENGEIPLEVVDLSVRRILTIMDRFGLLTGSPPPRPEIDQAADAAVARRIADAGAVLLRNEAQALPLTGQDLTDLVVVGPSAAAPLIGGGGSARVPAFRADPVLQALTRRAGPEGRVRYVPGIDLDGTVIPAAAFAPAGESGTRGLVRTAPDGQQLVVPHLDATGEGALRQSGTWTWSGTLVAPESGDYELRLHSGGGRARLQVDTESGRRGRGGFFGGGSLLPTAGGLSNARRPITLRAGERHTLTVTAEVGDEPAQVRLAWLTPSGREAALGQAVEAAREAEAVLIFAHREGTEGRDQASLSLTEGQDELIQAVADAARGKAVVVLNTGAPIAMPWLGSADAVLQMWYAGQEGAAATAAVLMGDVDPGGRLPVTFPAGETEQPAGTPLQYPGVNNEQAYSEGVFVGYRWYDARDVEPLFPFGHGLSYTDFEYSGLRVRALRSGEAEVIFEVRNSGSREGIEVAQVYVGAPPAPDVPMEEKQLAGFRRLDLKAGESRRVTIRIARRELSFWSPEEHAWILPAGERPVLVGSSSRDLRLSGSLPVR